MPARRPDGQPSTRHPVAMGEGRQNGQAPTHLRAQPESKAALADALALGYNKTLLRQFRRTKRSNVRDRIVKNYKAAAATLRDAAHLATQLADATRNYVTEDWSQITRRDHIDHSPLNGTLYVDRRGTVRRAAEMPKRLSLRRRIADGRSRVTHRVEALAALFEAAKIIRQRKSAGRQNRRAERLHRRQQNAHNRRGRISRMAHRFASRYGRT